MHILGFVLYVHRYVCTHMLLDTNINKLRVYDNVRTYQYAFSFVKLFNCEIALYMLMFNVV